MFHKWHPFRVLILFLIFLTPFTPLELQTAPPPKVDVLIGFENHPGAKDFAQIIGQGGTITRSFKIVPAVAVTLPQQALEGLIRNPNVLVVEPDGLFHAIDHETELTQVWGVTRIGSGVAHHDWSVTGSHVKVAVLDSGIDTDHPDLTNYVSGFDFVNDDADPDDDNGHGTHCAGTIGAVADGQGVVGVAPGVELYALKVLDANGSGSFSDIISALDWCVANGIDVTNNSYGSSQNPGSIVEQAFINANNSGVLNISSAGNEGNPRGKGDKVGYPARYASVVAVAATNQSDQRASFSSTGPDVELAAPGYQILSTYPGGQYATASGTSMACPHAVGTAALFIQAGLDAGVNVDNLLIRQVLSDSCEDLGASGRDKLYGFGLVNTVAGIALLQNSVVTPPTEPPTEPPAEDELTVATIDYSLSGGRRSDRDLTITLQVEESASSASVPDATVSVTIYRDGNNIGTGTGTTDSTGRVRFKVRKASSGTWTTTVNNVTANGYLWDNQFPVDNAFEK